MHEGKLGLYRHFSTGRASKHAAAAGIGGASTRSSPTPHVITCASCRGRCLDSKTVGVTAPATFPVLLPTREPVVGIAERGPKTGPNPYGFGSDPALDPPSWPSTRPLTRTRPRPRSRQRRRKRALAL